jgi:hypothetical protein
MKTIKLFFFIFLLPAMGCKQSPAKEPVFFYDSVHRLLDKAEPGLNELGDSVIAVQKHLRINNNYMADTGELRELLTQTMVTNQSVIDSISLLEDSDPATGLKAAALNYAQGWQTALAGEFTTWINELPLVMEDKAGYFENRMKPSLEEIQESSDYLTQKNRHYKKTFGF